MWAAGDGGSRRGQVVSHEGLERLLAQVGNGTAAASLRPCLGAALRAAADALTVSVQSCLLQHNIVGEHQRGPTATSPPVSC